jgi:hypothetical protein
MDVSLYQDIERRLVRLERENRRLRWAVASALIAAGMVLGSQLFPVYSAEAQTPPSASFRTLTVEQLLLRDHTNGVIRGIWSVKDDGEAQLRLSAQDSVLPSGAPPPLVGDIMEVGMGAAASSSGASTAGFWAIRPGDASSTAVTSLGVSTGSANLVLRDPTTQTITELPQRRP